MSCTAVTSSAKRTFCELALERLPELGEKPIELVLQPPTTADLVGDRLAPGVLELHKKKELCDVTLRCAGAVVSAHAAVLASQSDAFREAVAACAKPDAGPREVSLEGVTNPEAIHYMLDFVYGVSAEELDAFNPKSIEVTKDVLLLAKDYNFPHLTERAARWVARDITTGNVIERLGVCETFGLGSLRDKILQQLTYNRQALMEVVGSPQIMEHPALMQAMLRLAATAPPEAAPKKARKN